MLDFNILDVFDNIEIKNDTRLSEEDLKVISDLEEKFFKQRDFHFRMKELIESKEDCIYDGTTNYSSFKQNDLRESNYSAFMDETYRFTSAIYTYFENKYNIKLIKSNIVEYGDLKYVTRYRDNNANEKLEKFESLTKEDVIDDIFEQLGGFNFEDKAKQEVIEYLKKESTTYDKRKPKVQVKGKKVIINEFTYIDSFYPDRLSYCSEDKMRFLLKGISLYSDGLIDEGLLKKFKEERLKIKTSSFGIFEINKNKVDNIKLFKNRRVDIEFTSVTNAINFAKEFLSYEI